jgi:hypothetical protein
MIERMPRLNEEAQEKLNRGRQYNLKEGLDAWYNVFGGDCKKIELLNDPAYTSASRIALLFSQLRLAQGNAETEEDRQDQFE